MKAFLVLSAIMISLLSVSAAEAAPSYTDLWDISQGYTTGVQASSKLKYWQSNPRDMFGTANSYLEPGQFIFGGNGDNGYGWSRGTIHEVYWQTDTRLAISSFNLFASGSSTSRSFDHFNLSYFNTDTNSWASLYDSNVSIPYDGLVISAATSAIVPADSFRARFRQYSVTEWASGPRIIELDGYGSVVPEPATMSMLGLGLAGLFFRRKQRV